MVDTQDFRRLSISERLLLVEEIWDTIAHDQAMVPVAPEHLEEITRRLAEHRADPTNVLDWPTVKADLERLTR